MFKASVTVGDIVEDAAGDMQPPGGLRGRRSKERQRAAVTHSPPPSPGMTECDPQQSRGLGRGQERCLAKVEPGEGKVFLQAFNYVFFFTQYPNQ